MSASQVASNYLHGPWTLPAAPQAIAFAPIANMTARVGVPLVITNAATDPNQPPLPLTFSLLSPLAGAAIDADSGLFTWRPAVAQADTTNLITLQVANNGMPGLTATQSFVVRVNPVAWPGVANAGVSNGRFGFQINGDAGPDYLIQTSTNLLDWTTVLSTNSPALPFNWTDPSPALDAARFYRVRLGP
jgi:hypothetical protein